MIEDSCLQNLVSSIINEKIESHCRLCLRKIGEKFVYLDESLTINEENGVFTLLSDILTKLFDNEICQEIPGVDVVCTDCVNQAIQAYLFIQKCENSTKVLHNVFDNLTVAVNGNIDTLIKQKLYVVVSSEETKLVIVKDEPEETEEVQKDKLCLICNMYFNNFYDLKIHNLIEHNCHTCEKCFDIFQLESEEFTHRESEQMYNCNYCSVSYCTEESLKRHIYINHKIISVEWDKTKDLKKSEKYEKTQSKIKRICEKCGKLYATKNSYLKHVELCAEGKLEKYPIRNELVKDYKCKLCDKAYSTSSGLRVHERFVHGEAKPHVCEFCNKKFTAPSYLKVHMIKHTGAKNHTCNICNRKFSSKEALVYHTRRHTGEKPYSCNLCDQKFVNSSARAEHIKFKHVGPTLKCEMCPRKFVTRNFLRLHMKKHHDPASKFYVPRTLMPPNVPGEENMRIRLYRL